MKDGETMPPFLDTNILIYASSDDGRQQRAQEIMRQPFALSVQALNEFAHVARRKMHFEDDELRRSLNLIVGKARSVHAIILETHQYAIELSPRYNLSFYDALMVACALQAGSPVLYSEDMQHRLLVDDRFWHLPLQSPC
jgi:predicted nucleic acid-binding protein